MVSAWDDVLGGYTQLIQENKKQDGKCTLTLVVFDDIYEVLEDFTDISKVSEKLGTSPRGSTALLDAMGKTISSVGEKLEKMKEKDRPEKVLVIVQTDGYENASKEYTKDRIKKMITTQTEDYSWKFMFLGATLDSVNEAVRDYGFALGSTSTYSTEKFGQTFSCVSDKVLKTRGAHTKEEYDAATCFSAEDRSVLNN